MVAENSIASRLEINEHVDRRCEMIRDNQRRMINSLLKKPYKKGSNWQITHWRKRGQRTF